MSQLSIIFLAALVLWLFFLAGFGIGMKLRRNDIVDSLWGLGFVLIAWIAAPLSDNQTGIKYISLALVTVWALRLFYRLTMRNFAANRGEDWRYQEMRRKWGGSFVLQSFLKIYLLQAVLLLFVGAPVLAIFAAQKDFSNAAAYTGIAVWLFGILFEAVADYQLDRFKSQGKGKIMDRGLWRYSRHPNYFGEIVLWWGAGLVAVAAGQWWALVGPLTITFLLLKVSGVPLLEKKYDKDPAYQEYKKHTSALVPLPRR